MNLEAELTTLDTRRHYVVGILNLSQLKAGSLHVSIIKVETLSFIFSRESLHAIIEMSKFILLLVRLLHVQLFQFFEVFFAALLASKRGHNQRFFFFLQVANL